MPSIVKLTAEECLELLDERRRRFAAKAAHEAVLKSEYREAYQEWLDHHVELVEAQMDMQRCERSMAALRALPEGCPLTMWVPGSDHFLVQLEG